MTENFTCGCKSCCASARIDPKTVRILSAAPVNRIPVCDLMIPQITSKGMLKPIFNISWCPSCQQLCGNLKLPKEKVTIYEIRKHKKDHTMWDTDTYRTVEPFV